MNKRSILGFLLVAAFWLAACSASTPAPAPTTAPAAATSTPAANVQPTSAPVPTVAQPTAAPTTATTAASSSGAPSGNSADFLVNAFKNFFTRKVRVNMTTTDTADNKTTQSTIELQPPNGIHMIQKSENVEILIIKGQGTWLKQGGSAWMKSPVDMSASVPNIFDPATIDNLSKSVNTTPPTLVGPDVLDGKPMTVYTYVETVPSPATGKDVTSQNKVWIGVTDGLPYKIETDQPDLVTAGATTHSVVTYQYDDTINIQPPTP